MWMKRLMKTFSDGSSMWREWRTHDCKEGLLEESVLVVAQWVGRGRDAVKDCSKKSGLDVRQARRMMHDRSIWRGL